MGNWRFRAFLWREDETEVVYYIKKRKQRQVEKELRFSMAKGILIIEQSRAKEDGRGALSQEKAGAVHAAIQGAMRCGRLEKGWGVQGGNKSDAEERVGKVRTGGTIS